MSGGAENVIPSGVHIEPCGWFEPHEAHPQPGALRNVCLGVAAEDPFEGHHSAACANRRLTGRVLGVAHVCRCGRNG